jgi:hypothetical protein
LRESLQESKNDKESRMTSSLGFDYEEMPMRTPNLSQLDTSKNRFDFNHPSRPTSTIEIVKPCLKQN